MIIDQGFLLLLLTFRVPHARKVLGDETISFWAVDPSEYNYLIDNLKQFSEKLSSTVKESGNYTL